MYLKSLDSKRQFCNFCFKEDFGNFKDALSEFTDYIIKEKGEDIISLNRTENKEEEKTVEVLKEEKKEEKTEDPTTDFTEVSFDDLENEDVKE